MPRRRRAATALAGALALGATVAFAPSLQAQVPPLPSSTTTTSTTSTTAPSGSTATTAPPSGSDFTQGASTAPKGAKDAGGDGAVAPTGGIVVPPEAQRIIDSVHRTGPSSDADLLSRLDALRDLGLPEAEVLRVGMGRFPIAGAARYGHDWLYPRYGPGFRFHLGCDVFAAYGTPVRAPVDGVAVSGTNTLGGLTVKVVMPDQTYFYLAHLSGLVDGFTTGMAVRTGDIVGYVGDSGNAKGGAPHLHIGIYPRGGPPIDPKPVLDRFLYEASVRVPVLVDAYKRVNPAAASPAPAKTPAIDESRLLQPMLGTDLLHEVAAWPIAVLYLASANALSGPHLLVDAAVDDIVASIDWEARAATAARG